MTRRSDLLRKGGCSGIVKSRDKVLGLLTGLEIRQNGLADARSYRRRGKARAPDGS